MFNNYLNATVLYYYPTAIKLMVFTDAVVIRQYWDKSDLGYKINPIFLQ